MPVTPFPDGVSSFGLPLIGSGNDLVTTGKMFFVDSNLGNNGNNGKEPTKALATLDNAIGRCTANKGDIIVLMPGHAETVSSATAINLDVAGITIIGLGRGNDRPTFTLDTATTATLPVSAANITIKNVIFSMNYADIVAVFTLTTAKSFKVLGCRFKDTATDMNVKYIFDTNATTADADGLTMEDCEWSSPDTATIAVCKVDGTNARWKFKRNFISVLAQAAGGSLFTIATGKVLTDVDVRDNSFTFIGGDLSGAGVVVTTDGSTNSGNFINNYVQHTDTASEIFCTASSGFGFFENRMSGVRGATGYVLPAVDS